MINSKNKRFIVSIIFLFSVVLFMGSEDEGCFSCPGADVDNGRITVVNNSPSQLKIAIAGPTAITFIVGIGGSKGINVKPGAYGVRAYGAPYYNSEYFGTNFTLDKREEKTIPID